MNGSGKHKITAVNPPPPLPPPPPEDGSPAGVIFSVFFFVLLFYSILRACTAQNDDGAGPSAPQGPTPPERGVAIFQSNTQTNAPLTVVLGGGSYELIYYTVNKLAEVRRHYHSGPVFTADFNSGSTDGDLANASTIVLIGALKLEIEGIDSGALYADVVSREHTMNAYFNYSRSARGPPIDNGSAGRKKVIIVGELQELNVKDNYGGRRDINFLELEPSAEALSRYHEARQTYEFNKRQADFERQYREHFERTRTHPEYRR